MEKQKIDKLNRFIRIRGAREHNLKNVSVDIPKDALTIITGPSGSGKSSLALDVLYTEGKRRYMESLSSYARQFLGIAKKPDFDQIDGLCPAIAIDQKTVGMNPRSTVGTITEIYDFMRVLYARIGKLHCPDCLQPIVVQSAEAIGATLLTTFANKTVIIAAPIINQKKGEFTQQLLHLFAQGYYRFTIDGNPYRFSNQDDIKKMRLAKTYSHSIDVLIDAIEIKPIQQARMLEAIEKAFKLANNTAKVIVGYEQHIYSSQRMCLQCSNAFPELEARSFSFNSPVGACSKCFGLGIKQEWPINNGEQTGEPDKFRIHGHEKSCDACYGQRLNKFALAVTIADKSIFEICQLSIKDTLAFFKSLSLSKQEQLIAQNLIKEIISRLQFLCDVGLDYLSLNRSARTLSGGEGQRIRLARQIGSGLSGVLYILDEPSIGLHQWDNDRLINTLKALRDHGNTVVVVEHDAETMLQADYIVDMGPAAGILGGMVTATGTPAEIKKNNNSLTGTYLAGKKKIEIPKKRRKPTGYLKLQHARKNNLKDITVEIPLGVLCAVSGVSGSGKSTLILDELVPALSRELQKSAAEKSPANANDLIGAEHLKNLIVIDQSPIGRTPRSNPATYLGIFDEIRKLFAQLPESIARGYTPGRFSFNVEEGRCFECKGEGIITVSMQFLADVVIPCKACKGQRFNQETLAIVYKSKNISEILEMTAFEAAQFFASYAPIAKKLQLLCAVGLDYIKLGQLSSTLSGGEAQRIKLVEELAKRGNQTLYILDEPTTGLHTSDIEKLIIVFNQLIEKGNSMIVIEHNLDILKIADHIIDMGPAAGQAGGTIIASGTPEKIATNKKSKTGVYLNKYLHS
jgi:excinuclease ABC subunit A